MIFLGGIQLPDGMYWENELGYNKIAQVRSRSIAGNFISEEAIRVQGQIIDLAGGVDHAWLTRLELKALLTLTETPDNVLTFVRDLEPSFNVIFRRDGESSPIKSGQIIDCENADNDTLYYIDSIKLIKVM